jgi:hypothetical protein
MSKANELAAEVEGLERGKQKRRRYPAELRRRITDHVREQRAAGVQLNEIARGIGISSTLLHRWEQRLAQKFRRVELVAAPAKASRCSLHAPHGLRVEGLSLDDLVEVLRRLG